MHCTCCCCFSFISPPPSPHAFLRFFLLCDTAQELLLLRLGTPRVPHILQQILLLQVSSPPPLPLQLHSFSLSYVRQRVLIKRSALRAISTAAGGQLFVSVYTHPPSLFPSLSPPQTTLLLSEPSSLPLSASIYMCFALFVALLNCAHKYAIVFVLLHLRQLTASFHQFPLLYSCPLLILSLHIIDTFVATLNSTN